MNRNLMLLFPNVADVGTLSGGGWMPTRPLTNLQHRYISRTAESVDLAPTSTRFTFTLPRPLMIAAFIVVGMNLTTDATHTLTGRDEDGTIVYQETRDVWPHFFATPELDWENPNFWDGKPRSEDLERCSTWPLLHVLTQRTAGVSWELQINDPTNPEGRIKLGRLFVSSGHEFGTNYMWGATFGFENLTTVGGVPGGAEHFNVFDPYRVMNFSIDYLDDTEAFAKALDLMRRAGLDREVFVIPDPDGPDLLRRSFMGRLRQLSPLEQVALGFHSVSFEVKEIQG